jgi:hypothetical protein
MWIWTGGKKYYLQRVSGYQDFIESPINQPNEKNFVIR